MRRRLERPADIVTEKIFKQKIPCSDCPFRREGGVRHSKTMLAGYASYFTDMPGTTFPCHKTRPKDDDNSGWNPWAEGQVLCSGGLIFAAKQRALTLLTMYAIEQGWWDPRDYTPEQLAMVFDSVEEMIDGAPDGQE